MPSLLSRILLWQKFALLGAVSALAALVPLWLFVQSAWHVIDTVEQETNGLQLIRPLHLTIADMQRHRGLSALMIGGNAEAAGQAAARRREIDQRMAAFDAAFQRTGQAAFKEQWSQLLTGWNSLAQQIQQGNLKGGDSFRQHTALVEQLIEFSDLLTDHYKLNLDPDPDSYNLIHAAVVQSPHLTETLGRLRGRGAGLLAARAASIDDNIAMAAMMETAASVARESQRSIEKAVKANPVLQPELQSAVQAASESRRQALELVRQQILQPEQLSYSPPDYYAQFTRAIDSQLAVNDKVMAALERLLSLRKDRVAREQWLTLLAVALLLAAAAAASYMIVQSVVRPLRQAVAVANRISKGDLSNTIAVQGRDEFAQLLHALQQMNDGLVTIVRQVRDGATHIASASQQIANGNSDLSARTEQQASALQQTASSMEQLTAAVQQNASHARQASQLSENASAMAQSGGDMVSEMVGTMGAISQAADKIADIIGVIDSIAFQTNILALNAAVEAARAGEQGRGFAVVATEVRTLAQRAANAAREIKELITDAVARVESGNALADRTGGAMKEVVSGITRVTAVVSDMSQASMEQSDGITQISRAVVQMDDVTQQNAALVEQAAAAAAALQQQCVALLDAVRVFTVDDADGHPWTAASPRHHGDRHGQLPYMPTAFSSSSNASAT